MSTEDQLKPEATYQAVVGGVLVKLRKELGVDQMLLAKAIGVTQSTWSRIERGESSLSVAQLAKAAEYLRVNSSTVLLEVESAVKQLRKRGVSIAVASSQDAKSKTGIAMIGAAALGALIGAALKNKE
ncbi:MAG: helix-turn-helix transcriptional regulator [Alteromonadales bacterium]|nr:helix-turn-helix transcriptional regulator [Alteromonadales bacterium]